MTAESVVLLLVNKVDSIPGEEEGDDDIKLESPVVRWKKLIGHRSPEEAKAENADCLRAIFGKDDIKNAFHGSDDTKAANKERDIFLFPIPEKPPEFTFQRNKVTLDMILSFLFPPNLEHANSTGRLDLFAMYGPIVKYHSVDYCFCRDCMPIAKEQLQIAIAEKQAAERKKMGLSGTGAMSGFGSMGGSGTGTKINMRSSAGGGGKTVMQVKKLQDAPTRLLKEVDIIEIQDSLCDSCRAHCDGFVHLTSGRGGQHLNNDIEISELIREVNKSDLLQLLTVEKGSVARMMIENIDLTEPPEIMYKDDHVVELVKDLETDYYERYEFDDLQKMILEDRRLRMNYWISKITKKPIEKFKNPNLLNQNEKVNRRDIKNPYFSLQRLLPISVHMDKTKVVVPDANYDKLHFDYKQKYLQNEQDVIVQRTIGKEFHRVTTVENAKSNVAAANTLILRNYNDGRQGGWDNYCCYKGGNKGSYVDKKKTTVGVVTGEKAAKEAQAEEAKEK